MTLLERFVGVAKARTKRLLRRHPRLDADAAESVALEAAMTAATKYAEREKRPEDFAIGVIDARLLTAMRRGKLRGDAIRSFAPVSLTTHFSAGEPHAADPIDHRGDQAEAVVDAADLIERLFEQLSEADRQTVLDRLGGDGGQQTRQLRRIREAASLSR